MARLVTEAPQFDGPLADRSRAHPVRVRCGMLAKCPKRTTDFVRRVGLYASYDAQLFEYTRFFAAASIINAVLATLFAVVPAGHLPRCFGFLIEVGAALEITNGGYARTLARGVSNSGLDRALVCAEQDQLQRYVQAQQAERPREWIATRNELNGFLNERCAASIFCRCWAGRCSFGRVLRDVREHVGMKIDFGIEWHRVSIGMTLIDHIRRAKGPDARALNLRTFTLSARFA